MYWEDDTLIEPGDAVNLFPDCESFETGESGIHKVSSATMTLKNKAGYYSSGANKLYQWKTIRIRADVRGTIDDVFWGKIYRISGSHEGLKMPRLALHCFGLERKLIEDTITKSYQEEHESGTQDWTMKTMIEDFLFYTDSGYNTGITLETDNDIITTTPPMHNPNKNPLLDQLKQIGDAIGYDGYLYVYGIEKRLCFKKIGTVAANPSITLEAPFISLEPDFTSEPVGNQVFIWGSYDIGIPADGDQWTEKDILTNWDAYDNCTVEAVLSPVQYGKYAVGIKNTAFAVIGATFTVPAAMSPIDCTTDRFLGGGLKMVWQRLGGGIAYSQPPSVILWDDAATPNKIRYNPAIAWAGLPLDQFDDILFPVRTNITPSAPIPFYNNWQYIQGSNFSWKIKKIEICTQVQVLANSWLIIDGMYFQGGKEINPLKYRDELTRTDEASINAYGRRVLHQEDQLIKTFDQAGAIADYVLACNKDELKVITVKKGAKTWVHTNQYVTLNVPEWDISNEQWRTLEVNHEWSSKTKLLRTTMKLTPKDQRIGTQAYLAETLEGLIARWG